ncbi:hypothetical protein ACVDG5_032415 [Mesorhizobium sp. ORM6]
MSAGDILLWAAVPCLGFIAGAALYFELASFKRSKRLSASHGVGRRKLTGDEFVDAFDMFVNFIQNATSDYANEAGKFASIGASPQLDALSSVWINEPAFE